jgi:alkaline phosphatase D
MTLADYRLRYGQTKMDGHLQAAHLIGPWILTWDDHEVGNNYAGFQSGDSTITTEMMHPRRAAAYRAWWEHQPVRLPATKDWANLDIPRRAQWGSVAQFTVMDTRQYRSGQACAGGTKSVPCGEWADPARTLMGDRQEKWLLDGISASKAKWQVLANQVMMAPFDSQAGDGQRESMDQWSGYPVARDRLLGEIAKRAPNRTVVITGDIHSSWVNELKSSFSTPDAPTIGAEFVGTSISSGGDGNDRNLAQGRLAGDNPHIKWQNGRRGYVSCVVTPDEWRADYRTVEYVSKPDAPIVTPTKWVVKNGVAGIESA